MKQEFDKIQKILEASGMSEEEAEGHIMQLLEEEAEFYLHCKNLLAPLDKLTDEQRKELDEIIRNENRKMYN